ncbi:MAG: rRNA maturation RNase YbeY [Patescibacteria group bacterium]
MLEISFSNETSARVSPSAVKKIVLQTGRFEKKIKGEVEITMVGEKKIISLNSKYRGKNKVTDVLSFSLIEGGNDSPPFQGGVRGGLPSILLGQIFICYPQIVRQAKEYGVTVEEEFARMLAHGLLHLVGYDHVKPSDAKKMFRLQEKIVKLS